MNATAVLTFVVFLAMFATIGLSSVVRKKMSTEDYLLAGQDVKPWLVALAAVRKVLEGEFVPGFQTPSLAYGADFVLEREGVTREDVV